MDGPYAATVAARCEASSPAAATSAAGCRPSPEPESPPGDDQEVGAGPRGRVGVHRERRRDRGHEQHQPPRWAVPGGDGRRQGDQRAGQHRRAQQPLAARTSAGSPGTCPRELGAAGQPAQHVVEGARSAPGHDRATQRRPAGRAAARVRSGASARPGTATTGSVPSTTAGTTSGGRVSITITGSPRLASRATTVPIALASMGDRTTTTVPAVARNWSRSGTRWRGSPGRIRVSRPWMSRRWRAPAP